MVSFSFREEEFARDASIHTAFDRCKKAGDIFIRDMMVDCQGINEVDDE